MHRPEPISPADVLDQLRERVEESGRYQSDIAASVEPPMSASQLGQILTGQTRDIQLTTLLRILSALGLRLRDVDPRD